MPARKNETADEPMLFGMPLSKFPKAPPIEHHKPTLWELFKLGIWPPLPPVYYTPPKAAEERS